MLVTKVVVFFKKREKKRTATFKCQTKKRLVKTLHYRNSNVIQFWKAYKSLKRLIMGG